MHFKKLATHDLKIKLRKNFHLKQHQKIKYLIINLIKEEQNLNTKSYKTLLSKTEDINEWRDIPGPLVGRINIVKMAILPKLIYNFSTITIKIYKLTLIFMWKYKPPTLVKTILEKTSWSIYIPLIQNVIWSHSKQDHVVLVQG